MFFKSESKSHVVLICVHVPSDEFDNRELLLVCTSRSRWRSASGHLFCLVVTDQLGYATLGMTEVLNFYDDCKAKSSVTNNWLFPVCLFPR